MMDYAKADANSSLATDKTERVVEFTLTIKVRWELPPELTLDQEREGRVGMAMAFDCAIHHAQNAHGLVIPEFDEDDLPPMMDIHFN